MNVTALIVGLIAGLTAGVSIYCVLIERAGRNGCKLTRIESWACTRFQRRAIDRAVARILHPSERESES